MPWLRAEVRSEYALGAPELYRDANKEDPKEILEGVAVAGLVGVLRQLGDLADFAAEVFHSLQEEVAITSSRSHKLIARVHRIEAALSPLEKAILAQRSHLHFAYTAGSNWHARIRCEQNHFVYSDLPQFIMDSYEDCRGPPRLHLLDKFDPGGPGSCLKRYSDPTFFKRASLESGGVNAEKILKEKKGRKIKKRRSWPRNGEVSRGASFSYHSGRMEFIRKNVGAPTSPSQTASTLDGTLRSDLGEQSNRDLRNGSGYMEGDFRPSYSTQPEEQESRASYSSPLQRHDSDFLDFNFLEGKVPDSLDENHGTQPCDPAGCSSSSVTWDEKIDTLGPITHDYDRDGMSQVDEHERNSEFPSPKVDPETVGSTVNFGTGDIVDIASCDHTLPTLEIIGTYPDEVESETDHFMDALNTIESESETDIDCMKKPEVEHSSRSEGKEVDNGVCEGSRSTSENQYPKSKSVTVNGLVNGNCGQDHNSVPPGFPSAAYSSIGRVAAEDELRPVSPVNEASPVAGNCGQHHTSFPPGSPSAAYSSTGGVAAEDELKPVSPVNEASPVAQSIESLNPGSPHSIDTLENDNIEVGTTITSDVRDDNIPEVPFTDGPRSCSESKKPAPQNPTVTSGTFWTNGGLLGLQPSKPPDLSVANAVPEDPKIEKDENFSSSTKHLATGDKDLGKAEIVEDFKNMEERLAINSSNLEENETPFRKPSWKISPADLDVKLGKSGDLIHRTNANSTVMVSGSLWPVNPLFGTRKHEENSKSSSRMFELSNRLLITGSKKLLPGGMENSAPEKLQTANSSDQKIGRSTAHGIFSGQSKDLLGVDSLILSPSSSPPLEHMKISFQPLDGFETSKLKLKFHDGNVDNRNGRDAFPSFQLVPEVSTTRHNIDVDSDDDTFYRSSPSLSEDCLSHQSDSNSEQWESGESPSGKDHELYDAFRRMSLTESVSSVTVNGRTRHEDAHGNCGLEFPFVENSMQNSQSSRSLDRQSLETLNHSFREELRNSGNIKDLREPHVVATPAPPPPLPPVQWRGLRPDLDDTQYDVKISESAISQQPKPAPFYQEQYAEMTDVQKSKQFSTQKMNGAREVNQIKSTDENYFLHQIRTKSFNLRPTLKAKPTVPAGTSANVQITAILEKANAIRQAVASDDGEDDGTWSDT